MCAHMWGGSCDVTLRRPAEGERSCDLRPHARGGARLPRPREAVGVGLSVGYGEVRFHAVTASPGRVLHAEIPQGRARTPFTALGEGAWPFCGDQGAGCGAGGRLASRWPLHLRAPSLPSSGRDSSWGPRRRQRAAGLAVEVGGCVAVNGALSASWRELRPFCSSVSLALCGSHIWRAQWRFGPGKQLAGKMRLTFPGGDPQPPVGRSCRGNWTTCVRSRCAGTQAAPPPSLADIRGVLGLKVPSSGCKETGRAS